MLPRKHNRYDDLLGFLGGLLCVGISYIDPRWTRFWFGAGVLLIGWSIGSFLARLLRRS